MNGKFKLQEENNRNFREDIEEYINETVDTIRSIIDAKLEAQLNCSAKKIIKLSGRKL